MRSGLWLLALGACSNPYSECAGTLTGSFDGAGGGTASGSLTDDGDLDLFLVGENGNAIVTVTVPVEEDGALSTPDGQSVAIDGAMDLSACTASGTWASLDGSGNWAIAK